MFKSTKEFDEAINIVLKSFIENENFENMPPNLNEDDYNDILEHIVKVGNIVGITTQRTLNGNVFLYGSPSISREGLSFMENFKG